MGKMKSKLFLLGLLIVTATLAVANEKKSDESADTSSKATAITSSLVGVVMDKATGEPLTGVEVGIEGTSLKAYTDFDGNFSFESLNPGEYNVSASLISYKSNGSKSIKINGSMVHLNLELETVVK
jgi:hypothetical protein